MPLMKSASKKALSENIASEMRANPSPAKRAQNIAIAYSVKRQAMKKKAKKMAEGGEITAKDEERASADQKTQREMAMELGARPSLKQELDERDESMAKNSIDGADDMLEMDMMAEGGEVDARDESMAENSIDDARDERSLKMTASRSLQHSQDLLAGARRPSADDRDEQELDMIRMAEGGSVSDAIMAKRRMMADGGQVDLQDNSNEQLNEEDQLSYEAARKNTYYDDSQLSGQPEDSNMKGHDLSDEDSHDMVDTIRKKMRSKRM